MGDRGSSLGVCTHGNNISPLQDPAAEARMKVACITEQVLTLVNKRIGLYRHFDETINKYKQSRDVSTLNSGKKSLETEHKALTSEIALLQSRLKTEGSDLCDRVSVRHRGCVRFRARVRGRHMCVPSTASLLHQVKAGQPATGDHSVLAALEVVPKVLGSML